MHDDNHPWVSSSLFIEMLRKGHNELFAIDTVGKVGRWGIGLVGARDINVLNTNAFRQACDNISAWENDGEGSASAAYEVVHSSDADYRLFNKLQGASLFRIQGTRHTYFCLVKPLLGPPDGIGERPRLLGLVVKLLRGTPDDRNATTFTGYEVPLWAAAFPPNTPLLNLRP